MTLLDVGCGWGATMMRAVEQYDVDVVGLTLSRNQQAQVEKLFAASTSPRTKRVLLEGWEKFDEPVDRIVSIGAFEHFGQDRYDDFFDFAYHALPDDGVDDAAHHLHGQRGRCCRTRPHAEHAPDPVHQLHPERDLSRWPVAVGDEVEEHATKAGFRISRVQSLRPHYAKTLDLWAAALEARRDEAIAIQSEEVYDRYMKYLTGCADLFRTGHTDVCQFTLEKA